MECVVATVDCETDALHPAALEMPLMAESCSGNEATGMLGTSFSITRCGIGQSFGTNMKHLVTWHCKKHVPVPIHGLISVPCSATVSQRPFCLTYTRVNR